MKQGRLGVPWYGVVWHHVGTKNGEGPAFESQTAHQFRQLVILPSMSPSARWWDLPIQELDLDDRDWFAGQPHDESKPIGEVRVTREIVSRLVVVQVQGGCVLAFFRAQHRGGDPKRAFGLGLGSFHEGNFIQRPRTE